VIPVHEIRISACLIVKNESPHIEECLRSIRGEVDEICVVDTGSTDDTITISSRIADKVVSYNYCNDDSGLINDFSNARNFCLSLASHDYIFWIDGDDILETNSSLKDIISSHSYSKVFQIHAPYEYSRDSSSIADCLFFRERIIYPRKEFSWVGKIHETLCCKSLSVDTFISEEFLIRHRVFSHSKITEPRRNIRILESMDKSSLSPRDTYYLGSELRDNGEYNKSNEVLRDYISVSDWDQEKFEAYIKIADNYICLGDYHKSIYWFEESINIIPNRFESYFGLCRSYFSIEDFGKSAFNGRIALSTPDIKSTINNPSSRTAGIHNILGTCYLNMGNYKNSLYHYKIYSEKFPNDNNINKTILICEEKIKEENSLIESSYITIYDFLSRNNLRSDLNKFIESLPGNYVKNFYTKKLRISFYVGESVESWNPHTVSRGMGGSEISLVEISRRLASYGNEVTVYGDCPGSLSGEFDGVNFVHYSNISSIECDIFISSRRPEIFDMDIDSRINILWVHDVHCGDSLTIERSLKIDKFFCLSSWHMDYFRSIYPFISPDSIVRTRNGIDLNRFSSHPIRDRNRVVYGSSPDRGLEVLLKSWPEIKRKCPDSSLHIFYGFDNWEKCARNDSGQLHLIERLKFIIDSLSTFDVTFHGRTSQNDLAQEYLKSGVWAYPTWFSETSCVTAMEAQASGLFTVTSPIAALPETLGNNAFFIGGDWLSVEYKKDFIDKIVYSVNEKPDSDRSIIRDSAFQRFSWDNVALDWADMFDAYIEEKKNKIVSSYKSAT
jgi:glycosyltransferase involved in cell wall biosynthesis